MRFADQVPVNSSHSIDALAQVGVLIAGLNETALRMQCRAGLHTNEARWHLLKESEHIMPLQFAANDHLTLSINAMHLKNRLRNIQTDFLNCLHDWLL
jgi:hypothetical protein